MIGDEQDAARERHVLSAHNANPVCDADEQDDNEPYKEVRQLDQREDGQ